MGGESGVPDLPPKRTFEVIPGVGLPPVHFGMGEADVRRVLGNPDDEYPGAWFYHGECHLLINFDETGEVSFVELGWRSGGQCDVRYEDVSVFDTPAEELVRIISGELPATEEETFTSDELDLGLWRPVLPSYSSAEEPNEEYRGGRYWQTIGIGNHHQAGSD